jgi:hypothetical protein
MTNELWWERICSAVSHLPDVDRRIVEATWNNGGVLPKDELVKDLQLNGEEIEKRFEGAVARLRQAVSPQTSTHPIENDPEDMAKARAWAQGRFSEEEVLRVVRDIEENGGILLDDALDEIEREMKGS